MSTPESFFMPANHGTICHSAQRSPRVFRLFGVPGTVREWMEDFGAVLAGVAFVVLAGAFVAMVGR